MLEAAFWIYLIVGLVIDLVVASIFANAATSKGLSYWRYFWLTLLLTPVISFFIYMAEKPTGGDVIRRNGDGSREVNGERQVRCPECSEFVLATAKRCKHCGSDISKQQALALAEVQSKLARNEQVRIALLLEERDRERQLAFSQEKERERKQSARRAFFKSTRFRLIVVVLVVAISAGIFAISVIRADDQAKERQTNAEVAQYWPENKHNFQQVIQACESQVTSYFGDPGMSSVSLDDTRHGILIQSLDFAPEMSAFEDCLFFKLVGDSTVPRDSEQTLGAIHISRPSASDVEGLLIRSSRVWTPLPETPNEIKAQQALAECKASFGYTFFGAAAPDLWIYPSFGGDPDLTMNIHLMPIQKARCVVKALLGVDPGNNWMGNKAVDEFAVGSEMWIPLG